MERKELPAKVYRSLCICYVFREITPGGNGVKKKRVLEDICANREMTILWLGFLRVTP